MYNKFFNGQDRIGSNCIKWDALEKGVKPFWIADSDYQTSDEVIAGLIKRVSHGVFGYGLIEDDYYQTVINWYKQNYQVDLDKNWIIPNHGVVFSMYVALTLFTEESSNVVISRPVYNLFNDAILNSKRNPVYSDLIEDGLTYKLNFEDLEEKFKTSKAYILCNPHNPVGKVYTYNELERLVKLCKKYDVVLISDEIHCDIIMDSYKFTPTLSFRELYDKIIVCFAPSKTFNIAGLQIANTIIFNEEYNQMFRKRLSEMFLHSPNVLAVNACLNAYKYGLEYVKTQNKYILENYNLLKESLKETKATVFELQGTYLAWVDLSYLKITNEQLTTDLLDAKVMINSGIKYSPNHSLYIRINLATSRKNLVSGLKIITDYIKRKEQ